MDSGITRLRDEIPMPGDVGLHSDLEQVLAEFSACIRQVSIKNLTEAVSLVELAPRIFVAGAGRSGLCMKALGMRLMHLGKTAFVVGETTTTGIASSDLLVVGSGSGHTPSLLTIASQAGQRGAKILLFTSEENSPLSRLAYRRVVIPARSTQPLGTLFEQSLYILCDVLILELMRRCGVDALQMAARHANLE